MSTRQLQPSIRASGARISGGDVTRERSAVPDRPLDRWFDGWMQDGRSCGHGPSVSYGVAMRVHLTLAEKDVRRLDQRVGARGRSRFSAEAVRQALDDADRWEPVESAIGSLKDQDHAWDADPAAWARSQRRNDPLPTG
jgi:hypothetical protein